MDFIINTIVILAGVVLFFIFIYRNFSGKNTENGVCDCNSCLSRDCSAKQDSKTSADKAK